jgi:hypothetical protein
MESASTHARVTEDDIAVAEFLTMQAERRLEVVDVVDEPRERPRVYELPGEDSPRVPRTR